jgi:hypothetical protein
MNTYQNNKIPILNNEYHSSNINMNESSIDLEEALTHSSYPVYIQEFLSNFISKQYFNHKEAKVFFQFNQKEKLFVIVYNITIIFKNNATYVIKIMVVLPTLYPYYAPDFYIMKETHIGINDYYKDIINKSNMKITIDKICAYVPERNNIEEIIEKLKDKFKDNFPIYKDSGEKFGFEVIEECNFKKENVKEVRIKRNSFDDDELLEFMRNETKTHLRKEYDKFSKKYINYQTNYQNLVKINEEIKKNLADNSHQMQIKQELEKLKSIKTRVDNIEKSLIEETNELEKNNLNKSCFDRCSELIEIKDDEDMKYCVMEKAIEDYLIVLKKAFQKKIVSLNDMIYKTRNLSKELFYVEYMRNKRKYNNNNDYNDINE